MPKTTREPQTQNRVRLTALSHGAGCACKLGSDELTQVLRHVPQVSDPRVLVDAASRDDAAVFQMAIDRALVATVDFFTPIVDEPFTFGRIAAANAVSDLYAMGAKPLFALNLVAWPRAAEMLTLLGETLSGGAAIAREAGFAVLGGHSIDDPEPKYGMMVVGEAHPDRLLTIRGARPGDALLLTKPLGTGILSTALKRDLIDESGMTEAVRWMTTLNKGAMEAAQAVGAAVHACTDVTGFGLLGHLNNLLTASGVAARIRWEALRMLPDTLALAQQGAVSGGTRRNLTTAQGYTRFQESVPEPARILLADAQTSGGLLLAVDSAEAGRLANELAARGAGNAVIGEIVDAGGREGGRAGVIEVE
jgi:selenide,water dikinase